MSGGITIIERAEQHALCVSEVVGTMKLGKVMKPAYQLIIDHLKKHEIKYGEKICPSQDIRILTGKNCMGKAYFP